jgi:hypothetical protein
MGLLTTTTIQSVYRAMKRERVIDQLLARLAIGLSLGEQTSRGKYNENLQ